MTQRPIEWVEAAEEMLEIDFRFAKDKHSNCQVCVVYMN